MMHVLLTGNPIDGFAIEGPFDSHEAALEYAEKTTAFESWWVTEVQAPETDIEEETTDD